MSRRRTLSLFQIKQPSVSPIKVAIKVLVRNIICDKYDRVFFENG
jgi:hypothetical protein